MRFVFEIEPYEIEWIWDRLTEKAEAWAKEQEMEDDDAEDEYCDCDDESTEAEKADAVTEAFENLYKALRDATGTGDCKCHRRDASRSDD